MLGLFDKRVHFRGAAVLYVALEYVSVEVATVGAHDVLVFSALGYVSLTVSTFRCGFVATTRCTQGWTTKYRWDLSPAPRTALKCRYVCYKIFWEIFVLRYKITFAM